MIDVAKDEELFISFDAMFCGGKRVPIQVIFSIIYLP